MLVTTVVLFSIWRWRMRPGEERLDGPPIHGNTQLEVIWTALPAALIASLVVYAAIVLHDIGVKKPGEIKIGVIGQQWEWRFTYPSFHDAQGKPIVALQRQLPVNQPVDFRINSVDVIHTFWVPAFRLQEDAVPGITTGFRATPDRLGSYPMIRSAVRIRTFDHAHNAPHRHRRAVQQLAGRAWIRGGLHRAGHADSRRTHPSRRRRLDRLRPDRRHHDRHQGGIAMIARLRAPGLHRGILATPLGLGLAYAIVLPIRAASHYHPVLDGTAVLQVAMIVCPFGFLIGLGAFDYWFYWAIGRPTRPEDHSGHGARTWKDYFRVNTDHKVIGVQYLVTSFFFLLVGGLLAMLMRAELAQPGAQFVDANTYNGALLRPRDADDLPVRDPDVRRARATS